MTPFFHTLWRTHPALVGGLAGASVGLFDTGLLLALGVQIELAGRDAALPVLGFFTLTDAAFGFVVGKLVAARRALSAQYEAARLAHGRALHAEKLASVGRLAAGVAHEVRNPLGVIRSSAVVLGEISHTDPDAREASAFIVAEVDRLDHFVRRLLDFTRPVTPALRPVEWAQLAARAGQLAGAPVEVRGDAASEADPDLVLPVLVGLVLNAQQAGAARIEIQVEVEAGAARIRVRDDGPGVDVPHREALFEPFFTTRAGGHGLGLATARRVIEAHGGRLTYAVGEGLGPGGAGACFVLTTPHSPEAP